MAMPAINEVCIPYQIIALDLNKWDTYILAIIWELRNEPDVYVKFDKLNQKIGQLGRTPGQVANSIQRLKDALLVTEQTVQKWGADLLIYEYEQ